MIRALEDFVIDNVKNIKSLCYLIAFFSIFLSLTVSQFYWLFYLACVMPMCGELSICLANHLAHKQIRENYVIFDRWLKTYEENKNLQREE